MGTGCPQGALKTPHWSPEQSADKTEQMLSFSFTWEEKTWKRGDAAEASADTQSQPNSLLCGDLEGLNVLPTQVPGT